MTLQDGRTVALEPNQTIVEMSKGEAEASDNWEIVTAKEAAKAEVVEQTEGDD